MGQSSKAPTGKICPGLKLDKISYKINKIVFLFLIVCCVKKPLVFSLSNDSCDGLIRVLIKMDSRADKFFQNNFWFRCFKDNSKFVCECRLALLNSVHQNVPHLLFLTKFICLLSYSVVTLTLQQLIYHCDKQNFNFPWLSRFFNHLY